VGRRTAPVGRYLVSAIGDGTDLENGPVIDCDVCLDVGMAGGGAGHGTAVIDRHRGTRNLRSRTGVCSQYCANILVSKHQYEADMSRLTITLSEARYRALKEASAQRDKTIGQLIDESLDFYGIKSRQDARDLVHRARAHSKLSEDKALVVAQEQVRAVRRKP
jgi:sulfite reductase alpha subunit-like flavoprotein